jgi:multiple sugar transport system substrate-binding protein
MVASGLPPDLIWTTLGYGMRFFAARGQLLELDSRISRDRLDIADFGDSNLEACRWKGKLISVPSDSNMLVDFYNKTLLERSGVKPPPSDWKDKTWKWTTTYLESVRALTRHEGGTTTQWGAGGGIPTKYVAQVFGGDWFDRAAYISGFPTTFPYERQAVIDGIQLAADLVLRHRVQPTAAEAQAITPQGASAFASGKVGFVSALASNVANFKRTITGFEWKLAARPAPPSLPRRDFVYLNRWASFKGAKDEDMAWELLKHMMTPAMMAIFPLSAGRLPSRQSMYAPWRESQTRDFGLDDAQLRIVTNSLEFAYAAAEDQIVNWGNFFAEILQPELARVNAGEVAAQQAVTAMTPVALDFLRRTAA